MIKREPSTSNAYHLFQHIMAKGWDAQAAIHGVYVPARPLYGGTWIGRAKSAWMVFTGRADVLHWPGQE
jgi:hypothetical protein